MGKKKTHNFRWVVALTFIILGALWPVCIARADLPVQSEGPPPLPSSFYGTVQSGGMYLQSGTVTAHIDDVLIGQCEIYIYTGLPYYIITIQPDDPMTPEKDGGVEGDVITFRVKGSTTEEEAVWHSGTNVQLNLHTSPTAIRLVNFSAQPLPSLKLQKLLLMTVSISAIAAVCSLYSYRKWHQN